jgi:hypothetical protein
VNIHVPSPERVLAVAGATFTVTQALKRTYWAKHLVGWRASAFNGICAALPVLTAVPVDRLWSEATLAGILAAIIGATGVHRTEQSDSARKDPNDPQN